MATTLWFVVLLSLAYVSLYQVSTTLPLRHSTVVDGKIKDPSQDIASAEMTAQKVNDVKELPCSCGGDGRWTQVAHLNMNNPNQKCPSSWNLTTTPIRGCGRSSTEGNTCDSVLYSVKGRTYSSVCGRVIAIQRGSSLAFNNFSDQFVGIDSAYVSGVSLTHGPSNSRQHVWSFAGAMNKKKALYSGYNCLCSDTNITWPHHVPPYVGSDYFCDTGSPYYDYWLVSKTYFVDDPLWNGKGCESYSTCCAFNNPPWFCKSLPKPTSDDLEIRLCSKVSSEFEDKLIRLIDVYVK